jgi:hypothetical protein
MYVPGVFLTERDRSTCIPAVGSQCKACGWVTREIYKEKVESEIFGEFGFLQGSLNSCKR